MQPNGPARDLVPRQFADLHGTTRLEHRIARNHALCVLKAVCPNLDVACDMSGNAGLSRTPRETETVSNRAPTLKAAAFSEPGEVASPGVSVDGCAGRYIVVHEDDVVVHREWRSEEAD